MNLAVLFPNKLNSNWVIGCLLVFAMLSGLGSSVEAGSLDAPNQITASQGCVIPPSGPWPPCATGGNQSNNNNGCIIPQSGPWPPCASNGGGQSSNNNNGCIIPTSGPWPPCATNGNQNQPSSTNNNGCVIPSTGPWPPCATGGGQPSSGNSGSAETPATNTQNTQPVGKSWTFSASEARLMFVNLWNTRPHYETELGRDATFIMDNNVITLISPEKSETIDGVEKMTRKKMDFSYRISTNAGELSLSCIYLEAHFLRVDESDCQIVGDHLASWLTTRIKNDIWADEILSVSANGDDLVIGYR